MTQVKRYNPKPADLSSSAVQLSNTAAERIYESLLTQVVCGELKSRPLLLTYEVACKLIKRLGKNRRLGRKDVLKYADSLRRGLWPYTGQPIIIGSDGLVYDGQHRIYAVLETGISMVTHITEGVDPNSFSSMDIGKKRTSGQVLGVDGIQNSNAVASVLKLLHNVREGVAINGNETQECNGPLSQQLFAAYPEVVDSIQKSKTGGLIPVKTAATVHLLMQSFDPCAADLFFHQLRTLEGLQAGSPVLALNKKMRAYKHPKEGMEDGEDCLKPKSRIPFEVHKGWVVRAANAFIAGEQLVQIKDGPLCKSIMGVPHEFLKRPLKRAG